MGWSIYGICGLAQNVLTCVTFGKACYQLVSKTYKSTKKHKYNFKICPQFFNYLLLTCKHQLKKLKRFRCSFKVERVQCYFSNYRNLLFALPMRETEPFLKNLTFTLSRTDLLLCSENIKRHFEYYEHRFLQVPFLHKTHFPWILRKWKLDWFLTYIGLLDSTTE